MEKNQTFELLCHNYSPRHWATMASDPRRAYLWHCPTVRQLSQLYAPPCPQLWIDRQLTHLFLTSQSRDAGQAAAQTESFAAAFTASTASLKLSEVMLFLSRYKAGTYGRSFASFDLRSLGQAFHSEYLPERRRELSHIEQQLEQERSEREHTLRQRHSITREHYLKLPPTQPIQLILRLGPAATSLTLRELTRLLHLTTEQHALALTRQRFCASVTLELLPQLDALVRKRSLFVEDSWV